MLPKSRILLFQVLIPYLNFFFLFYYFTTVMIQFQDELGAVEYCMFEILVERDSIVRTSIDTKLTEHTSTQVIFISCQDFLLLAVLCLDGFADNLDGVIRPFDTNRRLHSDVRYSHYGACSVCRGTGRTFSALSGFRDIARLLSYENTP